MRRKRPAGPLRILVIEDEVHIQRLIQHLLEKAGYACTIAPNGLEGLRYLQTQEAPDLVLLDIVMPEIDGMTVLRTLRADPKHVATPVVMLTALSQEPIVKEGAALGVRDFIRKPFQPKEFRTRIARALA